MDIKHLVLLIGLAIGCALVTRGALADESGQQPQATTEGGIRTNVNLPPIFDFQKYKQIFDKTYRGLGEELNRARLFFARAFKVFIARVKYIHRSSGKYLAINHMSDWTPAERDAMYRLEGPGSPATRTGPAISREPAEISAADLDTIKRKLVELAERKNELPEFKQIADQLEAGKQQQQQQQRRRKRSAGSNLRSLPVESLVHDPSRIEREVSPKLVRYVPSSNPLHRDIELPSQGAEDDMDEVAEISEFERKQIETESLKAASLDRYVSGLSKEVEPSSDSGESAGGSGPAEDRMFLDLRDKNCTTPVKQQYGCGSCYIFATNDLFEYHYCMKTGKLVRFAEQYPIDCGPVKGLKGCNGGRPEKVTDFAKEYGLELGDYYGYKAAHRSCPYDLEQEKELAGHVRVGPFSRMGLMSGLYTDDRLIAQSLVVRGPLVIEVRTNEEFADYGGGVDMLENGREEHGHAMTLLGHGIEDGREYWLIKNSHGLDWGEKGYYKLDKRTNPEGLWFDYLDVEFMDNDKHDPELVRQKIIKNLPLHEKMFGWTGYYNRN